MQQTKAVDTNAVDWKIQARFDSLQPTDICALFLLTLERRDGQGEKLNMEAAAERTSSLLSRFFRSTDVVGFLGQNRFAGFLAGRLTGGVMWDKAQTLSEALWFATEDISAEAAVSYVGVYMFHAGDEGYESAMRRAEYALEMAHNNGGHRFYIYAAPGIDVPERAPLPKLYSPQMFTNYVDEGVRLLKVGADLEMIYISPGFYRRLGLTGEDAVPERIQMHPADRAGYEEAVRKTALEGGQRINNFRLYREGGSAWIPCSVRLLRVSSAATGAVVLEISHNTAGLERLKNQYEEKKEWLRFLTDETDFQLWEVELKTDTFRLLYTKDLQDGRQTAYANFPESLIETGRVHRDSARQFRAFAKEMYAGKPSGKMNFILQYRSTSCYGWGALAYHTLFDEDGHPDKIIGVIEDLSSQPMQQSRASTRRAVPANLFPHLYCYLQANLTSDVTEKLTLEGRDRLRVARYQTYTEIVGKGVARLFSREDEERIARRFARERLLTDYGRGEHWLYDRCQVVDGDGDIRWVAIGANLCADSETGEICLFAYMSLKDRQLEEEANCSMDELLRTGAYDASSAARMAQLALQRGGVEMCALAKIQVGGAQELFVPEGREWRDMCIALNIFLDTDCILWRSKDDSVWVFFPRAGSRTALRRRIEEALSFVRRSLTDMPQMRFVRMVASVCCHSVDGAKWQDMVRTAAQMSALHAGEAADAVFIAEETYLQDDVELSGASPERLAAQQLEPANLLTEEDKEVALECTELMLRAEGADGAINGVLERLGVHYRADRVYILALTDGGATITMLNEWVRTGKHSLQHSISGKRTRDFPVIERYAGSSSPVILSRRSEALADRPIDSGDSGAVEIAWQYAIFPMEPADESRQLLCVENPSANSVSMALVERLLPHIAAARRWRFADKNAKSPLDRLYALPGWKKYFDLVYGMDSEHYKSMGAAAVDIPDFDRVKSMQGYEFGMKLLLRVSEVLQEVFSKAEIFHTREEEFVVLSPNQSSPAFINHCARAKQLMGRRYMGLFRMGCTWSDGIFQSTDLVRKARSIMKCATPSAPPVLNLHSEGAGAGIVTATSEGGVESLGQMTAYLQPKVDMRTGEVLGAEALLRVLDERGALLSHARLIQSMEEEGSISRVDYFVFDKVLSTLSSWGKKGYRPIRVSSNFSRKTLLNPTALASMLAILSRYPDVGQDQVALEITETAGDMENNTVSEIMDRFGNYGLQFDLDDFGSSYSNMSMLANHHFRSVKLDRSLVRGVASNQVSRMMVRDIAEICSSCGMLCVAEGVETQTQAEALMQQGCVFAQGYYYGRPMPIEEFEDRYLRKMENEGGNVFYGTVKQTDLTGE